LLEDFQINASYPTRFHPEAQIEHLACCAALNGVTTRREYTSYCDLGCGTGLTGYILAAANPAIKFTGIDIDDDALERARRRAASGGLDNCVYTLPGEGHISRERFSVVFAHGIYSWVDSATRESLKQFFHNHIEDKGLLFLSYNLLPGWDCLSFIKQQFSSSLEESPDDPEQAARRALRRLIELRDAGALAFHHNQAAIGFVNYLVEMDNPQYTVQEFYGSDHQAFSFDAIHDAMRRCGLSYAADASMPENRLDLVIAESGLGLLAQCESAKELQPTKDLLQNRLFRRDIYIAGDPSHALGNPGGQALDSIMLGIYGISPELPRRLSSFPGKSVDLNGDLVQRLEADYKHRRFCIRDLIEDDAVETGYDELLHDLLLLMTEGYIGPFARDFRQFSGREPGRVKIPRYNRVLMETPEEERHKIFVASPVVGSGMLISPQDCLLLRAFEHEDPAEWLIDQAPRVVDNTPLFASTLQDFFSSRAEIDDQIGEFSARLEAYLALGFVE
jgi:SAM-dependent methyltransferase